MCQRNVLDSLNGCPLLVFKPCTAQKMLSRKGWYDTATCVFMSLFLFLCGQDWPFMASRIQQQLEFYQSPKDEVFGRGPKTDEFRAFVRLEEHNRSIFSSSTIDQWIWCVAAFFRISCLQAVLLELLLRSTRQDIFRWFQQQPRLNFCRHISLGMQSTLELQLWPGLTFHGLKDATTTWVLPKPKRRGLWSRSQNWRVQSICEAWRAQPIHFLQLNHRSMDLMCSCVLSHQLSASCFAGIAAAKDKARYFQMISTTTKT